jgi:hypothetical protein
MQDWMKYAGLGAQFFASILIMLALGWKLDEWLHFESPILIWILPLLIIIFNLVKLIIETNKKS